MFELAGFRIENSVLGLSLALKPEQFAQAAVPSRRRGQRLDRPTRKFYWRGVFRLGLR